MAILLKMRRWFRIRRLRRLRLLMSYQYIYILQDLRKAYSGGKEILGGITLQFLPGAKIGVLGRNGSGKSTLLRIMAGIDKEFSGTAESAANVRVGYLPQEPFLDDSLSAGENVMEGFSEIRKVLDEFNEVSMKFGEVTDSDEVQALMDRQGELQGIIDAADAWDLESQAEVAMSALGCVAFDTSVGNLSGGERRRIALCRLLLFKPDMLLLDEPTNHLDAETISWLQRFLQDYSGTVVMVTHDRYFLDSITGWILELDRGRGIPYEGNYSSWLEQKQNRLRQENREEKSRMNALEREREWISASPKARQAKSKARVQAYEELLHRAKNRPAGVAQIEIPLPPRLGDVVVECNNISKSYGGRLLFNDFSFSIPAGAIVGIIGGNGVGKTSLLRILTGQESPDSGSVRLGETVRLGYVDQSRDSLKASATVWEEISDGLDFIDLGVRQVPSRSFVASFNFQGSDQQKVVGQLSGGERNRVHMAKMLKSGSNLLLLDEPTNDLDIDVLRALEDALIDFAGSALIVSHDRWFLDRLSTHILSFEGNSEVVMFAGNYAEYESDRERRYGKVALENAKHRRFKR